MSSKMGGRPKLIDDTQILLAAVSMGVEQMSMNGVARKLGVSTTALYRYYPSKQALLDACMDHFCGRIRLPDVALPWDQYLSGVGHAFRNALLETPGASAYGVKLGPTTPAAFQIMDVSLGVLMRAGFDERDAWSAYSQVVDHAFNYVQKEEQFRRLESEHGAGGYRVLRLEEDELARFPYLQRALSNMGEFDFDESYERQLSVIVAGLREKKGGT